MDEKWAYKMKMWQLILVVLNKSTTSPDLPVRAYPAGWLLPKIAHWAIY